MTNDGLPRDVHGNYYVAALRIKGRRERVCVVGQGESWALWSETAQSYLRGLSHVSPGEATSYASERAAHDALADLAGAR